MGNCPIDDLLWRGETCMCVGGYWGRHVGVGGIHIILGEG